MGIDLLRINRIGDVYSKHKENFLNKVFNESEISYIEKKNFKGETIASMFSFKEAISKSLGTGFGKDLKFKDITISHDSLGRPSGVVGDIKFDLSASHDGDYVVTVSSYTNDKLEIEDSIRDLFKKRKDKFHKGDFGKSMIIASSKGMVGSGYLASLAALKSGCGLTYHYVFEEDDILLPLSIKHTEVIVRDSNPLRDLKTMDGVLFGCGLGISRHKRQLLSDLLEEDIYLVIDADGINILAEDLSKLLVKKARVVLTPHVLEFSRLTKEFIPPGKRLYNLAKNFAKTYKVILVLKDSKTMITDGENVYFIDKENSGMATAGSGDVLAGIITSLISQSYDIFDAALLGANIHSLAGQVAMDEKSKSSMLARDIIDCLDKVFKSLEER